MVSDIAQNGYHRCVSSNGSTPLIRIVLDNVHATSDPGSQMRTTTVRGQDGYRLTLALIAIPLGYLSSGCSDPYNAHRARVRTAASVSLECSESKITVIGIKKILRR